MQSTKTTPLIQKPDFFKRGGWWLALGLAFVPFAVLLYYCLKYTVDIPYFDQWEFIPFLEKSYQGTLSLTDFWAQHNEHRILFSRAIMLVLARLTAWNILAEVLTNVALAVGICGLLAYQTSLSLKKLGKAGVNWLIPLCAALVFSLNQWENWTWGWQIPILLNTLVVVAGIVVLNNAPFSWLKFGLAVSFGIMSSYTFASGIVYWFIGLGMLFLVNRQEKRKLTLSLILWTLAGTLTTLTYLYDYTQPANHPSLLLIFQQPVTYTGYVLAYLGSQLRILDNVWSAALTGGLGLVLQGWLLWALWRRGIKFEVILPYLAMSLYAIGGALITGIGRAGFGEVQAVTPRYVTISYLFWIANVVFLYLLVATRRATSSNNFDLKSNLYALALATIIILVCYSSFRARIPLAQRYDRLEAVRTSLIAAGPKAEPTKQQLDELFWVDEQAVRDGLEFLKKRHLSIYRN